MYRLSSRGFRLISSFESLKLEAYLDPAGIATIGYGTTKLNGFPVALGMVINEAVAVALLYGSCNEILKELPRHVLVNKLNQNQIDALCSLIYNIGISNFATSSLLQALNHKLDINRDLFTRWNKTHIAGVLVELPGLTRRRNQEYNLFMEHM